DYEGYKNLMKLSSIGCLEGFYYKPRVDKEVLRQYSGGLIALSGCLKGEVACLIAQEQYEMAESVVNTYKDIFGEENFYLEMQDHGIEGQKKVNDKLPDVAKKCGVGLVASNDCHYIYPNQSFVHEVLLCVQTATNLEDPKRMRFQTNE
ncbi:unnamed protein product, partial [marine sediment metagenome]